MRRLVLQPEPSREDVLSLEEILAEGVEQRDQSHTGTPPPRICKARIKALQQAAYYSAEHGYLDVTMEIRDMGESAKLLLSKLFFLLDSNILLSEHTSLT